MLGYNRLSMGLLPDTINHANTHKQIEVAELEKLNLSEIIQVDFPDNQYYRKQTSKNQIVLHHTVSGEGVNGDLNWWLQTASRIATHMVIGHDGKIYQCYSTKYWAHHLGVKSDFIKKMGTKVSNTTLNKKAIGIEIDSWGGLVRYNREWYPGKWDSDKKRMVANLKVRPIKNVQIYSEGYRGFYGFEKYTAEQIEAVRQLLVFWNERYDIPLTYNDTMWDVDKEALNGKSGVWTHTSYRKDKSDCHPQPELVEMLKSLA